MLVIVCLWYKNCSSCAPGKQRSTGYEIKLLLVIHVDDANNETIGHGRDTLASEIKGVDTVNRSNTTNNTREPEEPAGPTNPKIERRKRANDGECFMGRNRCLDHSTAQIS